MSVFLVEMGTYSLSLKAHSHLVLNNRNLAMKNLSIKFWVVDGNCYRFKYFSIASFRKIVLQDFKPILKKINFLVGARFVSKFFSNFRSKFRARGNIFLIISVNMFWNSGFNEIAVLVRAKRCPFPLKIDHSSVLFKLLA